jgi:hypothetical protein
MNGSALRSESRRDGHCYGRPDRGVSPYWARPERSPAHPGSREHPLPHGCVVAWVTRSGQIPTAARLFTVMTEPSQVEPQPHERVRAGHQTLLGVAVLAPDRMSFPAPQRSGSLDSAAQGMGVGGLLRVSDRPVSGRHPRADRLRCRDGHLTSADGGAPGPPAGRSPWCSPPPPHVSVSSLKPIPRHF